LVPRLLIELAVAAAGLIGGHFVSYVLSTPDAAIRRLILIRTGHSYWPRVVAIAGALAAVAIIGGLVTGFVRARSRGSVLVWGSTFRRLAMAQTAGFGLLEVLERKTTGAPLSDLGAVLPRGVLVQILVAAIAASALWLLDRAGESIAHALRDGSRLPSEISAVWRPTSSPWVPASVPSLGSISLRGPPLPRR
jgi:hypothetical protein